MAQLRTNLHRAFRFGLYPVIGFIALLLSTDQSAAKTNIAIFNDSGTEIWFYKNTDGWPSKNSNTIKGTRIGAGKAYLVGSDQLFKWKSKTAIWTKIGDRCGGNGSDKLFRRFSYGTWDHRKATKSEADLWKRMVSMPLPGNPYKKMYDERNKETWRKSDAGSVCVDSRFKVGCVSLIVKHDSIRVGADNKGLIQKSCGNAFLKVISYKADDLANAAKVATKKVEDIGEKVADATKEALKAVANAIDVGYEACHAAAKSIGSALTPPDPTGGALQLECQRGTARGFLCASTMYIKEMKDAPDTFLQSLKTMRENKDCKDKSAPGDALCGLYQTVKDDLKRPLYCMKELANSSTLQSLFKAASSKSTGSAISEEACVIAGEAAFEQAVIGRGFKIAKKSKKDKIAKIAKRLETAQKAHKKVSSKVKSNDIVNQLTKDKMPNCYGML